MKQFTITFLLLISLSGVAQNFEDQWTGLFSYVSVKGISQGNGKVFVGSENAAFDYDLATQEIETTSTVNGLSGEIISTVYYSENFGVLLLGYENGLIEVRIDGEEDILKVVDILEKLTIPPNRKRINDFYEYNGVVYISTEFGISVFDLSRLEFGDTYFIGDLGSQINISQTTVLEPYIYAGSTEGGVRRAMVDDDNLIDFAQWTTISTRVILGIRTVGDQVYVARGNNTIGRLQGSVFGDVGTINDDIVDFQSVDDILTITSEESIRAYDSDFNNLATVTSLPDFTYELQSGIAFDNTLYLGTTENGLLLVPFGTTSAMQVFPEGPILNNSFSIDASPGQLWVCYGDVTQTFNPFPLDFRGVSRLLDNSWTNIAADQLLGASDLVEAKINPQDTSQVYMSSFQQGLLRIQGGEPDTLFDDTNSPLERAVINGNDAGIRIFGSEFDREGNLWFVQSRVKEGLIRLSPSGQFRIFNFEAIIDGENELALTDLDISRDGFVFWGTQQSGLYAYDPARDAYNRIGTAAGSGNLPSPRVRALEFDAQNRLWIGTSKGLRVLFNVAGFFEDGANVESQPIIIEEDGVGQELLADQTITDIEVDGSNNKWVATSTSGVFYFSSNGQETLLRFTKDNSPLPSNNVQDIAIDSFSGRVYFATVNGLVAFEGTSTAPRDNLENVFAFPNPVRPGFTGNVTIDGLTANANVKITDIEGNLVFETTSQGG
ncbi:MAG: two-component regulator propeller domain-containing protein, partial [Bacteroidota bacterium]